MDIAVIGSGISGLVAAYLLHPAHRVTVFEANDYVGGHTHTITVRDGERPIDIDTGFIVFNPIHYPNFTSLLERLEVASQPTSMSFSVRCERTGLEYNGTSLNKVFAQRRNLLKPSFWKFLFEIMRFNREALRLLEEAPDDALSVAEFVRRNGYSSAFSDYYLLPLGASLWSCPPRLFSEFPIRFVIEFLRNHCMLQVEGRPPWRVIRGGSRQYVTVMTRGLRESIFTGRPVERVRRVSGGVSVEWAAGREVFDEVVVATHSDQALKMLIDPEPVEEDLLGAFPYQKNVAVLHTDPSVLPRCRSAWASWNYRIPLEASDRVSVSYNMNMLQSLKTDRLYCVSLNQKVDEKQVLRRIPYEHPVYTRHRLEAQRRHSELIRRRGISYCGAYWGYGFHEDGVNSALRVVSAFGRGLHS